MPADDLILLVIHRVFDETAINVYRAYQRYNCWLQVLYTVD